MKNTLTKKIFSFFASAFLVGTSFAQTELTVNCYPTEAYENAYYLDGVLQDYALYSSDPAFYVVVINQSNCTPWGTNFQGANPDHSFGNINESGGRNRVEYYFTFQYNDSVQLDGMLNMLQVIPTGHSIVIYTPITYDYSWVNGVNSNLTQELSARWNSSIIEGNQMMVLYGEQGNSGSYVSETTVNPDGYIEFTHNVCNALGVKEDAEVDNLLISTSLNKVVLNPELTIESIEVFDGLGRKTTFDLNENVISFNSIEAGVFMIRMNVNGEMRQVKVMLGN